MDEGVKSKKKIIINKLFVSVVSVHETLYMAYTKITKFCFVVEV